MPPATTARLAVNALPLCLLLVSVASLLAAPLSWGAARHAGLAAWMPPFTALAFGLPGLTIAALSLGQLSQRTSQAFRVFTFQLFFGVLALLVMTIVIAVVAVRVADPSTYDSLIGIGERAPPTQAFEQPISPAEVSAQGTSPEGYMLVVTFVAAALAAVTAMAAYLYVSAIDSAPRPRFQSDDELDAVGELLRGRRGPRSRL
jgi:hypothetical protein